MNSDNIPIYVKHYPQFFDLTKYYYDSPPGWDKIILRICQQAERRNIEFTCVQTKEKFGGLRFYFDVPEDSDSIEYQTLSQIVEHAEWASFSICERCGISNPTVCTKGTGWSLTLCEKCRREQCKG